MTTPRVFAYSRIPMVVTADEDARDQIIRAGYKIYGGRYVEEQVFGFVPAAKRHGFQGLLSRMKKGDTLVVATLDCIGRDAADVLKTIKLLAGRGARITVLQLGNLDLASTAGQLVIATLEATADLQRERMRDSCRMGQAQAKLDGRHIGRPSKTSPEERQEIRQLLAEGMSVSEVARRFSEPEGRTICRTTVMNIRDQR